MQRIKPIILPAAIVLGLFFHDFCTTLAPVVPYVIFSILLLTFSSIELRRLRFEKLDLWLGGAQLIMSVVLYFGALLVSRNQTIAQGLLMASLCPVAASVTVVAVMLGAKPTSTIAYTIVGNLLVSAIAPVFFLFIGNGDLGNLTDSFFAIFGRISTVIGLPFFVMLFIQMWIKPLGRAIRSISSLSFYLWAIALLLTLGQTIDFIFLHGKGNWYIIITLGVGAAILCPLQFYIGRCVGRKYHDQVAGQQLLGQKNTAMGIWMSNTYLNPLASTILAFYSIAQNLINSWQLYRHRQSSTGA